MTLAALALVACTPSDGPTGRTVTELERQLVGSTSEAFGAAVASAGDVDGDGFDDVLVGAARDGSSCCTGSREPGEVSLFPGAPGGVAAQASWRVVGDVADAGLGEAIASAGDVNGDGFDDVVVGARNRSGRRGAAYVYLGSPTGPSPTPDWTAEGASAGDQFGDAVASAGDVNGDGYDDLVVGASHDLDGQWAVGGAFVFLGSPSGPSATADWFVQGSGVDFGCSAASAGDVNGDGFDDVIVGHSQFTHPELWEGAASVWLGSPAGLSAVPDWSVEADDDRSRLGATVASAGDVNGDGFDDVVLAAPEAASVRVYLGSSAGLSAAPDWSVAGAQPDDGFGRSVASAGDVDGDGFDDVVVGAPREAVELVDEGAVHLYRGSASGLSSTPELVLAGGRSGSRFGWAVASAGDVDGDGLGDLVVGADEYSGQQAPGAAFVYTDVFGDADADGVLDHLDACPSVADTEQLDRDDDGLGNACDVPDLRIVGVLSAGGRVSLVALGVAPGEAVRFAGAVGSGGAGPCPPALGGACLGLGRGAVDLGTSVGAADGTARLRVTFPSGVAPGGSYVVQAGVPRGAGGAGSVLSPVVVLGPDDLDWDADGLSDAGEASWGTDPRVADTDADGLADGEDLPPRFDPLAVDADGDGVLDGADACWIADDALDADGDLVPDACDLCPGVADPAQDDADRDGLGDACERALLVRDAWTGQGWVPAVGDLDGDGALDVAIGGPDSWGGLPGAGGLDSQGRVAAWPGSPTGPSGRASWTAEGGQAGARFGSAVAFADVNGDGRADLVVGTPDADGSVVDQGVVALWLGSPGGFAAAPAWSAWGGPTETRFGEAVAAGDVDGDGFEDVVVGARWAGSPWDGQAFLYLGSAAGLSAGPGWLGAPDPSLSSPNYGAAVATGDLDGDGFDDVVVGGPSNGGLVFVHHGSPAGPPADPDWSAAGTVGTALGTALATGDVNGDGFADLVVGAPGAFVGRGQAFVYAGSAAGPEADPVWSETGREASVHHTYGADEEGSLLGSAVAAADVDGDGFADVVVGSPAADQGRLFEAGRVDLFLGGPEGPAPEAVFTALGDTLAGRLGTSFATGDLDGDGLDDLLTGKEGALEVQLFFARP